MAGLLWGPLGRNQRLKEWGQSRHTYPASNIWQPASSLFQSYLRTCAIMRTCMYTFFDQRLLALAGMFRLLKSEHGGLVVLWRCPLESNGWCSFSLFMQLLGADSIFRPKIPSLQLQSLLLGRHGESWWEHVWRTKSKIIFNIYSVENCDTVASARQLPRSSTFFSTVRPKPKFPNINPTHPDSQAVIKSYQLSVQVGTQTGSDDNRAPKPASGFWKIKVFHPWKGWTNIIAYNRKLLVVSGPDLEQAWRHSFFHFEKATITHTAWGE